MDFETPLVAGELLQRYKRFLADVRLDDGRIVTAHSANTGAMTGCCTPGSRVWLRHCPDPKRKCPYTWELVETAPGILTGINTARANALVEEAIVAGRVPQLAGYEQIRREVRYGRESSRIDLLLEDSDRPPCYVEVKNVTLMQGQTALFPDAVTQRGSKHLRELEYMLSSGARAVIFYCIPRQDAADFRPADAVDPFYGQTLRQAMASGVEAMAWRAEVSPQSILLTDEVPVICPT